MATRSNIKKYLPIGLAVAAGAALLYWSRKASAMPLPPAPTPGDEPSGGGGGGQPSGGGGGGGNAPPFQSRTTQANSAIDAYYSEWIAMLGVVLDDRGSSGPANMDDFRIAKANLNIPSGRTPGSWFTDVTMDQIYGLEPGSIPKNANNTWQPWKNEWNRVWNRFTSKPLDPTA